MSNNYINPNFSSQYPYQINGNYNVPSKGIDNIKTQDNMAGKLADNYDPSDKPGTMGKSFLYGLLMSAGFVRLTNWLMTPKNITDTMTQADSYTSSRLYKMGKKLDNFGPFKWLTNQAGRVSGAIKRIPMPKFVREIGQHIKTGSVAPWDSTGMYSLGKQAEAMKETVEFFSKVGDDALKLLKLSPNNEKTLLEVMGKVRAGKIDSILAYKKIAPLMENVSAKTLKEISAKSGKFAKFLDTTFDLNLSLSKAKFFAGTNVSGPVGKVFNKLTSLVGEASGGGVLGGKMALIMNAAGLMSGFNSMQKAEKGDKLAAFMEDYIGLTIGGYLMSMVVGKWFNKAMGTAEMGMDKSVIKGIADKLGTEGADTVQKLVVAYNKDFKQFGTLNKILDKVNSGKVVQGGGGPIGWLMRKLKGQISLEKANAMLSKSGVKSAAADVASLRTIAQNAVGTKNTAFFDGVRQQIKSAMKSNITFKSIFTKSADGASLLTRAGRWFVQKPLAAAGRLLSVGRYTLLKDGTKIGNFARWFKRAGGGVGRMILVGFVLVEPFRKMFVKLSHKIFGKPKHSIIDDEKKNNKDVKANQPQSVNNQPQTRPSQNLVDLYMQNMPKTERAAVNPNSLKADTATYMPNQILGQESYVDPALTQDLLLRRDMILSRADAAERNARNLLNSL